MRRQKERRQHPREFLPSPEVGILYPEYSKKGEESDIEGRLDTLLVNLLNRSKGGLLLESFLEFKVGSSLDILVRLPHEEVWQAFKGKVKWVDKKPNKQNRCLFGIKFQPGTSHIEAPMHKEEVRKKRMYPRDLEFLMQIPLFDSISQESRCPLLNCMTPKHLQAGERLISQGDEGDTLYIIQNGSCVVGVEKHGKEHPIRRLRAGDVVGEMAILTGERRTASVDAETDMSLWSIGRGQFDALCREHPDLRNFLTELITNRFSTEKMTADRTVGKYVINEIIGKGGWSIVYKGIHAGLNMPVAIKMLNHDMAMRPEFTERFKNEAKIIAKLNHENIVKVYDIEEVYRTIFIIMEYLDGVSLKFILEKMPRLPLPRVLDILLQVCAGLSYAHQHSIIHQDIKPDNIFIQPDDRAKIVDFGLACIPGAIEDLGWPGSVFYTSPEQIEGDPVNESTDIYSLGIAAYEMITGQRPFPEDNVAKVMNFHLNEDTPDPRTLIPDLPEELSNFLISATRREPAARYQSISQILHALKPLAEKMGLESRSQQREQRKMMSLFLFYQDQHQLALNRLVEDFSNELKKIGAVVRAADFKDF